MSGFLGHCAALGCNKCMKVFSTHEENWLRRDGVAHRHSVVQVAKETTQTGISAAESKYGVRYSVLLHYLTLMLFDSQ